MLTKVTTKPLQKKSKESVKVIKAGTTYAAFGSDALLISHSLKLTFFTKKILGTSFHSTTFSEGHFEQFEERLKEKGISVQVENIS